MKFPQLPGRKSRKDKLLEQLRDQQAAPASEPRPDAEAPLSAADHVAAASEPIAPRPSAAEHVAASAQPQRRMSASEYAGGAPTEEPAETEAPQPLDLSALEAEESSEPEVLLPVPEETPAVPISDDTVPIPRISAVDAAAAARSNVVDGWDDEPPADLESGAESRPADGDKKRGLRGARIKAPRRSVISLDGFRDPVRRPRYLLWTFAALLAMAAFMVMALGVTSTRWFCSEACHKVQDDTITAYQHSSHKEISCMACHMPVGASPVVFILHKAEALGELYLTVTNQFELPLNGQSAVSLEMDSRQCTQCHNLDLRKITPSEGILIDHKAHSDRGIQCPVCHNRIAHREDFELALNDPESGDANRKHADFMTMTSCFRCHTQDEAHGPVKAPGKCSACHPPEFQLKPASHLEPGFFPGKHGKLAAAEASRVAQAEARAKGEGEGAEGATESTQSGTESGTAESGTSESGESADGEELRGPELGMALPNPQTMNYCYTCHAQKFCTDCHGVPMPHPADFKKGHGQYGKKNPQKCARCHGSADKFCDECHHGTSLKWKLDPKRTWVQQHFQAVGKYGASACFQCHEPTYCAHCHVSGKPSQ